MSANCSRLNKRVGDSRKGIISIMNAVHCSLLVQKRIVKWVDQLLSLCDALEDRLADAARERRRTVMVVMAEVGTLQRRRNYVK